MVKIDNPTMHTDFKIEGIWKESWDSDNEYIGNLEFYPSKRNRIELTLTDVVPELRILKRIPYFYGITLKGKYVILIDCRIRSVKNSTLSQIIITAQTMIIGKSKITNIEEIKSKEVSFKFHLLDEWMSKKVWKYRDKDEYIFEEPELEEYELPGIEATLKEKYVLKSVRKVDGFSLTAEKYYKLEFEKENSFDEFISKINKITNFYYFLFSQYVPIKFIEFKMGQTQYDEGLVVSNTYQVYYLGINNKISSKNNSNNLISYQNISEKLGKLLNNWIDRYEDLKVIIQLFVGDLQVDSFAENQFLNACRSIEAFHRIFLDSGSYSSGYEDIENELLKVLEGKEDRIKEYFTPKISYKQLSFNKRVKDVLSSLPPEFCKELIPGSSSFSNKKKSFAKKVSDTRNYLTHANNEKKNDVFEGLDLIIAMKILYLIFEYVIFRKLGLEDNNIENILCKSDRYYAIFHRE